jgi:hypothetical protein
MKLKHRHTPHKSHKTHRRRDYASNFNAYANPHMAWEFDKATNQFLLKYLPKHYQPTGRVIWDSWRQGTRRKTMDKSGNPAYYSENNIRPKHRETRKAA